MLTMKRRLTGVGLALLLGTCGQVKASPSVERILEQIGTKRGICVVLGEDHVALAVDLARVSEFLVYVQLGDEDATRDARQAAEKVGLLGTRIFIDRGDPRNLHLADHLADAVIAPADAPETEVLRVLCPNGKALLGDREIVKPLPEGIDDWSHPYHGPDNNPVSTDRLARAPYLTQFLAGPRFSPAPTNVVASAGRYFEAFGNVAFHKREESMLNTLAAFNGYNGTMLWSRPLTPGIMVHRNTMIATPDRLYVGDDRSCKVYETTTGKILDEIAPPADKVGGTFWKWMALENGVLYAVIGEQELKDSVEKWGREAHGWPWEAISRGYNQPQHEWGFGRCIVAIDLKTKTPLWVYREDEPIDTRAVCMKNGRIFFHRFKSYVGCLDAQDGKILWRKTPQNDPRLFDVLGKYLEQRQSWVTNWRTTAYARCSDKVLYFAGPQVDKLIALSAEDGRLLWSNPYSNYQLIIFDDALYGVSGPWRAHLDEKSDQRSKKFNPLTGAELASYDMSRRACTRVTASTDGIFSRAMGGSWRFHLADGSLQYLSPMRPACFDGVVIANGMLHWGPWCCDCQLTLYGYTALGPAGDFDFSQPARDAERLEKGPGSPPNNVDVLNSADWPTFRANNQCTAASEVTIPGRIDKLWMVNLETKASSTIPTAPVAAYDMVYLGASDGIVRALDATTGALRWKAYTGGAIRLPPTLWNGRAYVGSGDGWVYCLNALNGEQLWRFRVAPRERKIPVYGSLLSTWPAAAGVLVEKGIVYVAAGIVNYDGTHVYALDAETGRIKWQNNTSGHLAPAGQSGVSVQGHMLINDDKLYLAGGNAVSPAVYDLADGRCLNTNLESLNLCESISPRGWELFKVGDRVVACGQPYYVDANNVVFDDWMVKKVSVAQAGDRHIFWENNKELICTPRVANDVLNRCVNEQKFEGYRISPWGKLELPVQPTWTQECADSTAVAVGKNAVLVSTPEHLVAFDLAGGKELWSTRKWTPTVPWGLAVDRDGRIFVVLTDGTIRGYGEANAQ